MAKTMELRDGINAVPDFDPRELVVEYINKNNESRLHLNFEGSRVWFQLAYPGGRADLETLFINDKVATFKATLRDKDGNPVGLPGTGSCYFSTEDEIHRNFVQTATTKAYCCAFRNSGFGTPANACFIEGVTQTVSAEKTDEEPVDLGVEPKISATTLVPPPVKASRKGAIDDVPASAPAPTRAVKVPKTYEEALKYTIPSGSQQGKTMEELKSEEDGKKKVSFFLQDKYKNDPRGIAARLIAGQEGF